MMNTEITSMVYFLQALGLGELADQEENHRTGNDDRVKLSTAGA